MTTPRETAQKIADITQNRIWILRNLEDLIEAAILEERERCAKIVETYDLTEWVKGGGALREIFAAEIRKG